MCGRSYDMIQVRVEKNKKHPVEVAKNKVEIKKEYERKNKGKNSQVQEHRHEDPLIFEKPALLVVGGAYISPSPLLQALHHGHAVIISQTVSLTDQEAQHPP